MFSNELKDWGGVFHAVGVAFVFDDHFDRTAEGFVTFFKDGVILLVGNGVVLVAADEEDGNFRFRERFQEIDRALFRFEGFGVGLIAKSLFKVFPRCWGSIGGGVVSGDEFSGRPAEDIADAVIDINAVNFFGVVGGPAEEGKSAATDGCHGTSFGEAVFFGDVFVGGIDVGISFGMACDITMSDDDVVAFVDKLEVGFIDAIDAFPEEAAPEPGFSGGRFFGSDNLNASSVVVDAEFVVIEALELRLFSGEELGRFVSKGEGRKDEEYQDKKAFHDGGSWRVLIWATESSLNGNFYRFDHGDRYQF